jgi:hypothetical protein
MSKELFPFGISDKEELKKSGDVSFFLNDGTPHLVDFSPRVVPSPTPAAPVQPVVAADPKEGSAQEPAYSTGDATQNPPSSEKPDVDPKAPVQPDATGATTKSKESATSKQTSSPPTPKS